MGVAALLGSLVAVGPVAAAVDPADCTISWAAAVDGDWSVAGNWAENRVPGPTDVVCLVVPGEYTVDAPTSTTTVAGLLVDPGVGGDVLLELGGVAGNAALRVTGDLQVGATGALELTGADGDDDAFVEVDGTGEVAGVLAVTGDTSTGGQRGVAGDWSVTGTMDVQAPVEVYDTGSQLHLAGTLVQGLDGRLQALGGVSLTVAGGAITGTNAVDVRNSELHLTSGTVDVPVQASSATLSFGDAWTDPVAMTAYAFDNHLQTDLPAAVTVTLVSGLDPLTGGTSTARLNLDAGTVLAGDVVTSSNDPVYDFVYLGLPDEATVTLTGSMQASAGTQLSLRGTDDAAPHGMLRVEGEILVPGTFRIYDDLELTPSATVSGAGDVVVQSGGAPGTVLGTGAITTGSVSMYGRVYPGGDGVGEVDFTGVTNYWDGVNSQYEIDAAAVDDHDVVVVPPQTAIYGELELDVLSTYAPRRCDTIDAFPAAHDQHLDLVLGDLAVGADASWQRIQHRTGPGAGERTGALRVLSDTTPLTVADTAIEVPEGGSREVTACLGNAPGDTSTGPTDAVEVVATVDGAGVDVAPVTTTVGDQPDHAWWWQPWTITVTAAQDDDLADGATTVGLTTASNDAAYDALAAEDVVVTVRDDDAEPDPEPDPDPDRDPDPEPEPDLQPEPEPEPEPLPSFDDDVARLSGPDRFATAAAVSRAAFAPGIDVAFLATGSDFPDALAGGPLAAALGAPILLTSHALPPATAEELARLQPTTVVALGGTGAVPQEVLDAAGAAAGDAATDRIAGASRFETAAEIADRLDGADVAYLATGLDFPDALAGGPVTDGAPILLVGPDSLPEATAAALAAMRPERVVALGGGVAVAAEVLAAAATAAGGAEPDRLAGPSRYETAIEITGLAASTDTVFVATGTNFPDALAAAPVAAMLGAGLVLTTPEMLPAATSAHLQATTPTQVVLLGGTGAVSDDVRNQIASLVGG